MTKPAWGRPHEHDYKQTGRIGTLVVERCSCGAVRHVIWEEWADEAPTEQS